MSDIDRKYSLELWELNICPNCGQFIPEGTRVGSGQKADGGFCSLDCYTKFYALELVERAQRLMKLIQQARNN